MEKLKITIRLSVKSLAIISFLLTKVHAQDLDKHQVENAVHAKEFVFKAQTVMPMSGGSKQLTTENDVKFLGDSIVSYLPYFGRAYNASYGSSDGGINFTSTKFDYKAKAGKKGAWNITVKPNDVKDIQEMNFTISENGSASLNVTSHNRQPISFYGHIIKPK
jgi:hypothetical protein